MEKRFRSSTFAVLLVTEVLLSVLFLHYNPYWLQDPICKYTQWLHWQPLIIAGALALNVALLSAGSDRGWFQLPNSLTIRKILAYDDVLLLSILIMLAFLAQITWFIDSLYALIFNIGDQDHFSLWMASGLSFLTMIELLYIYPYRTARDTKLNTRTHLYTPLSCSNKGACDIKNLDLLVKPIIKSVTIQSCQTNQAAGSDKKPETGFLSYLKQITILPSSEFKFTFTNDVPVNRKDGSPILYYQNLLRALSPYIGKNGEQPEERSEEAKKEHIITLIKGLAKHLISETFKDTDASVKESLEKMISELTISFSTEPLDYNDFLNSFKPTARCIKKKEKRTDDTLLYISPGTAIVSMSMITLAMKGDRLILYCDQKNDNVYAVNPDEAMAYIRKEVLSN